MIALKHKLNMGFTGLLTLLLLLGTLAIALLDRYSQTLTKVFHDNYNSVIFGQNMKDAVDALDDEAQTALWSHQVEQRGSSEAVLAFDQALEHEKGNITIPGEELLAEALTRDWPLYKIEFGQGSKNLGDRSYYLERLRPLSAKLKSEAQAIIDLNLSNIVSADGAIKANTDFARRAMYAFLISGVFIAAIFVFFISRSIMRPLQIVTESAREIERGNLDLTLPVDSTDELGQLLSAFNAMVARLREFRREDKAHLFRTQKTTQVALDSFPEAVALIGLDGKVELSNDLAVSRFGLVQGYDLVKGEHKILWNQFQETFTTLAPVQSRGYSQVIQLFLNGDEYFFLPQTLPMLDDDRLLTGVTLVLTDVTNLRRIDESKSGMLSVVSHELKTPLTSIRMATHLLLDERIGELNPKQLELILAAREDSERLRRIIDNLLDISRIESGQNLADLSALAPERLLRNAVEPFDTMAREQGVPIRIQAPHDLPDVWVDLTRIYHVFGNLLSNALKHTTAGGRIDVRAVVDAGGEAVQFSVENTGKPIPEEYQAKIFERFFRMPDAQETSGVGLGLAIARDITHLHGGTMGVANRPQNDGVRFYFTLPTKPERKV